MKTPEQIINEIRNFISNSKPFRFSHSEEAVLNSLTELENTLFPTEIPVLPEPEVIAEPIVEEVVEESIVEETEVTEEEPVVAKKSTKKK